METTVGLVIYNYERHTNEGWPETSQWKLFPCHNAILVLVHMPSKLKGDSTAIATDTNHEHNHKSDQPELTWSACLWRDQEVRDGVAKIGIRIYCVHIPGFVFCRGTWKGHHSGRRLNLYGMVCNGGGNQEIWVNNWKWYDVISSANLFRYVTKGILEGKSNRLRKCRLVIAW